MRRRHKTTNRATLLPAGLILSGLILSSLILSGLGLGAGNAQEPPPAPAPDFHRWSGGGLKVELAPLTHEQAMAFLLGRGFTSAMARRIVGTGCIFRSNIGNRAAGPGSPPVTLDLTRWRIDRGDGPRPLRLIDDWFADWSPPEVSKPARIAFRWALFPVRQTFGPGDFNWGLFTFGLPPGSRFDLSMRWHLNGAERQGALTGLTCAGGNGG